MKKYSAVLVGICGYGGGYLNEVLFEKHKDDFEVKGIVEITPERSGRYNEIVEKGIKFYKTLEEFYAENTADIAFISTPIAFHAEQIICCMENGSNVVCEKPLCADEKDIDLMEEAQKKYNKFLVVGYQWSTQESILNMKADITNGVYGKPKMMKTLVLWPRNLAYYQRASWAGRKCTANGKLVYDSIANNATAHYLHNMFYLVDEYDLIDKMPEIVSAEVGRANDIENFDTIVLNYKMKNGADGYFIASHATKAGTDPIVCYEFEKGKIINVCPLVEENNVTYGKNGDFIGILNDGTIKNYGSPDDAGSMGNKVAVALELLKGNEMKYCKLENASIHTRVINYIQNNFEIKNFKNKELINNETYGDFVVVDGLDDLMFSIYNDPKCGVLDKFIEG